jgi:GT2 family glycosyltransferase
LSSFASVVICTYNRARLLERALHSLARQTLLPEHFEVIVVDDGSVDNTAGVCDKMRSRMPNLKYISTGNHISLSHARNIGIGEASGNYLLFTDDDCIAAEDWVGCMIAALDRMEIAAGAVANTAKNYFTLSHNIAQFHAFMPGGKAGPIKFIAGANMGFRRSVLEELGGFQTERKYAGDMNFILRARAKGYNAFFVPDTVVIHDPDRTSFRSIVKYSADHASVTILLRNRYRSILHTPFILRSPALLLITAPIIALKATAGIYLGNPQIAKLFWTAPMVYLLKLAWCWGAARGLRNRNKAVKEI